MSYSASQKCSPYEAFNLSSSKLAASTFEQAINKLRKQLNIVKAQKQKQFITYKQQLTKYEDQIKSLKRKILFLNEKEYLKSVLQMQSQNQKRNQKTHLQSLQEELQKCKLINDKLNSQIRKKDQIIQKLQQDKNTLNKNIKTLQKQKQKHLELSILQKINLQEKIQVLEQQNKSKQTLLNNLKASNQQKVQKQIDVQKKQRQILKKMKQLQIFQTQLNNFNSFQKQKLIKKLQSLSQQNQFLRGHIQKLEKNFIQLDSECGCINKKCKNEIQLFKQKYINKTKQLSKIKVQMSKQLFKEEFMKDVKDFKEDKRSKQKTKCINRNLQQNSRMNQLKSRQLSVNKLHSINKDKIAVSTEYSEQRAHSKHSLQQNLENIQPKYFETITNKQLNFLRSKQNLQSRKLSSSSSLYNSPEYKQSQFR